MDGDQSKSPPAKFSGIWNWDRGDTKFLVVSSPEIITVIIIFENGKL